MFKLRSVVATSRQWTSAPIALAAVAKVFNGRVVLLAAAAVVSLLARPAVVEAPTDAAETAADPRSYSGAGGASCTHPLFAGLKYGAGDGPQSVAIGDLDGVNGPDLAVANQNSDDVSVLLNQGHGTFAAAVANDAAMPPLSVALCDLDGVNGPDLAVANFYSDDVSVLLNLCTAQVCPWDLSGDGEVNVADLLLLLADFGTCDGTQADFDGDGCVTVVDLLALIANFGPCPGSGCPWDVNGDGTVDQTDLRLVRGNFGPCDGCPEDVNGDGIVNGLDVSAVATHFGPGP